MKLKPLMEWVVVEPIGEPQQTAHNIVTLGSPDSHKRFGEVIAVGDGVPTKSGRLRKLCVKKGDRVLYDPEDVIEVKHEGAVLEIVRESSLYAVVK